jgi:hypothetical protein
LYELIVNTEFSGKFDAIVLDPLAAFANTSSQINTGIVTRLITPSLGKKQNIFILHESNKKNPDSIKGGNALGKLSRSTVWVDWYEEGKYIFRAHTAFNPIPTVFMADMSQSRSGGFDFQLSSDDAPSETKTKPESVIEQVLAVIRGAKRITRGQLYGKVPAAHGTIDNKLRELAGGPNAKIRITMAGKGQENRVKDVIELVA